MMEPVRIAVLGSGYWGRKLSREYVAIQSTTGEALLSYVVDASEAVLTDVKREIHTGTKFASDYRVVLEDDEVDAVHIALPNELHFPVAKEALEAGKHVLLEKPMATSARDAFKLVALSEECGSTLLVGHIFRFNNAINMVKSLLAERRIGDVFYAKLDWAVNMPPPKGRDIVFDLAAHPIDVLNYLLRDWPTRVDAVGGSFIRRNEKEEEMAFINLEFPNRVLANVYLSWIQHGLKERSVRIVGEKGTITCDALNQKVLVYDDKGVAELPRATFPSSRPGNGNQNSAEPNNTIRDMEYHFIDCIKERGPGLNTATVGARSVQVLETVTTLMRRRRQSLDLPFPMTYAER
jgi:UDP-N-acetylglucosamine 3-dehydrogenase